MASSPTFDAFADFRMAGHSVLITGGAQNIGAAIAKTLAGAGASVMIADLNGDAGIDPAMQEELKHPTVVRLFGD